MMIKRSLGIFFLFLLISLNAVSQCTGDPSDPGTPIDVDDPPCSVPLDNWVIVLVIIALVYAGYQLHRKQKAFSA